MAKISLTDVQVRRLIEATSFPPRGMGIHELRLRLSDCTNAFLRGFYFQSGPKPPPSHAVKRFGGIRTRARELRDAMPRTDVIDPEPFDAVQRLYRDVEAIADRMGLRILPVQPEIPASQDEIDTRALGRDLEEIRKWASHLHHRQMLQVERRKRDRVKHHEGDVAFQRLIGDLVGIWVGAFERLPGVSLGARSDLDGSEFHGPFIRFVDEYLAIVRENLGPEVLENNAPLRHALNPSDEAIRERFRRTGISRLKHIDPV